MRRTIIYVLLSVLFVPLCLSCSDDEANEPIRFNLPQNFSIKVPDESVYIIKDIETFNDFFGEEKAVLETVDFKKYDLVYIQGTSSYGIEDISVQWNIDVKPYSLSIKVKNNYTTAYCVWSIAYLLEKGDKNYTVDTDISYIKK